MRVLSTIFVYSHVFLRCCLVQNVKIVFDCSNVQCMFPNVFNSTQSVYCFHRTVTAAVTYSHAIDEKSNINIFLDSVSLFARMHVQADE